MKCTWLSSLALSVMMPAAPALATPTSVDDCIAAHAETQRKQLGGALREARTLAIACAQETCPSEIRSECSTWSSQLEQRIPSVVVRVVRGSTEITNARILVGDTPVSRGAGIATATDAGTIRIRVTLPSGETREQQVLMLEGEKSRLVQVAFPTALPPAGTTRPVPALVWVFAGLSAGSLAGFAGLGLHGNARKDDLDELGCAPACPRDEVDAIKREYIIADVLAGLSVVSFGTGLILFFTRPEVPVSSGSVGPKVQLLASPATFQLIVRTPL